MDRIVIAHSMVRVVKYPSLKFKKLLRNRIAKNSQLIKSASMEVYNEVYEKELIYLINEWKENNAIINSQILEEQIWDKVYSCL